MSAYQEFHVMDNSSIGNFKDWAQSIETAFTTFGWSRHSDSGQVDWGTIAAVPGASTYVYAIMKPGDAGTAFYVKLEWGGSTTNPIFRISIGTGTNGSGTLTGFVTTATQLLSATNGGSTTFECNYSGDDNRVSIMMNRVPSNANQAMFFAIERTLDTAGDPTNVGVSMFLAGDLLGNPSGWQGSIIFGVGVGPTAGSGKAWTFLNMYDKNTWTFNNQIPISPVFPNLGYFGNPQTVAAVCASVDIVTGGIFDTTLYGNTVTYMRGGGTPSFDRVGVTAGVNVLCMRYD
jgi:hypothetical protein